MTAPSFGAMAFLCAAGAVHAVVRREPLGWPLLLGVLGAGCAWGALR